MLSKHTVWTSKCDFLPCLLWELQYKIELGFFHDNLPPLLITKSDNASSSHHLHTLPFILNPIPSLSISFPWTHTASSPLSLLAPLHLSNAGSRRSLSLPSCCLYCRSTVFLAWRAVVPSLELFIIFSKKITTGKRLHHWNWQSHFLLLFS